MFVLFRAQKPFVMLYFVVLLFMGSYLGRGWSFVPISFVNEKSTRCFRGASPDRNAVSSRRRYLPLLYFSKPSDDSTDEEGDDEGWNNRDTGIMGNGRVQPTNLQEPKDRDLFIPIFSLIAIGGFVSLYGYEMIRLYLRGELYLPFLH